MGSLPDHAVSRALEILLQHLEPTHTADALPSHNDINVDPPPNELGNDSSQLELVLQVFYNRVKARIQELCLSENSQLPIYRLPCEIIGEILKMVSQPSRFGCGESQIKQDFRDIIKTNLMLSQVSSRLRTIALSTPHLWVNLHNSFDLHLVEELIQRSKELPLHIAVSPKSSEEEEIPFMDLVHQHMARWITFQSWSPSICVTSYEFLSSHPAPILEAFSINCKETIIVREQLTQFFDNHAPKLYHLSIFPLDTFSLDSKVLSGLTSLSFTARICSRFFTSDQFQTLFSSSPNLEIVHIKGRGSRPHVFQVMDFRVSLMKLRHIHLEDLPDVGVGAVLSSIHIDPSIYPVVRITQSYDYPHIPDMFPTSARPNSLLAHIRSMSWLSVADRPGFQGIGLRTGIYIDGTRRELLTYNGRVEDPASSLFQNLVQPGCMSNLKDIRVIGDDFLQDGQLIKDLPSCPDLEVLMLWRSAMYMGPPGVLNMDFLNEAVEKTLNTGWWSSSVPCPKLKRLSLGGGPNLSPILEIVQSRISDPKAAGIKMLEIGILKGQDPTHTQGDILLQLEQLLAEQNGKMSLAEVSFSSLNYAAAVLPDD